MEKTSSSIRWLALAGIQLAHLLAAIDATAVAIVLPDLARDLKISPGDAGWVITVYYVANVVLMPLVGRLADSYGRKRIFLAGFAVFTLGALMCGVAPTLEVLLGARVLQAVGAACLMANGSAISAELFDGPARGIALGLNSTVTAAGYALGYVVGGLMIGHLGWRPIFLIEVPIALLAVAITAWAVPRLRPGVRVAIPAVNVVLLGLGLGAALYGLRIVGGEGRIGATSGMILAGASVILILFFMIEWRSAQPILPGHLFRQAAFGGSALLLFLFILMLAVTGYLLPFYLREVLKLSGTMAGLALVPYSVAICIAAPFTGWFAARGMSAWLIIGGFGLASAVAAFYAITLGTDGSWVAVAWGQGLLGLAGGLFFSPNRVASLGSVPGGELGTANSMLQTVRALAYALGTAAASLLLQSTVTGSGNFSEVSFVAVNSAIYVTVAGLLGAGAVFGVGRMIRMRRALALSSIS